LMYGAGPGDLGGVPGGRLRPKIQGKRPDVVRCGWNRAPRAFAVLDSTLHKPYAVAPQMTRKSTTKKSAGTTVRRSTYQRVTCERWPANSAGVRPARDRRGPPRSRSPQPSCSSFDGMLAFFLATCPPCAQVDSDAYGFRLFGLGR